MPDVARIVCRAPAVVAARKALLTVIVLVLALWGRDALAQATSARTPRKSRAIATRKLSKSPETKRFDQPEEALRFYLLKRSPDGVSPLTMDKYFRALDQMAQMPQYSTVAGKFLPSRAEIATGSAASQTALGTWSWLGPGNVGGRTRALLIHPTSPATMYAAGVAGGVWKSTDAGTSWTPISDLMTNIAVTTLAFEPGNPSILYAGTGEGFLNLDAVRGAGIFKTTDGGTTWAQLANTANSNFHYVNKLVVSPATPSHVYAATRTGIFRSTDSGATWTKVQAAASASDVGFTDLVIRTDQATDWLFAAEGSFSPGAIWRNTDAAGAGTWTMVYSEANQARTSLALAPSNQDTVYAMMASLQAGNYNFGLLAVVASTTGGGLGSWSDRVRNTSATTLNTLLLTNPVYTSSACVGAGNNAFFNQGWYDNVIAVDPTNPNTLWAGGIDLFRSTDGGANWQLASYWWASPGANPQYAHADQHAIVFHPQYDGSSNQTLYVGNDGGLFRTDNAVTGTTSTSLCPSPFTNTLSWTMLNNGYGVTQFYAGAVYPDGNTFFGGTQDNGTIRGTIAGGPDAWAAILGGDGGYAAVDPTSTNTLYGEFTGLSIQKSTNGGSVWNPATSGISESAGNFLFITPFAMDPSNAQNLWVGGAYPWRTTNGATAWARNGDFFGTRVSAIAVANTDPNTVLMGTQTGVIFRTSSASTNTSTTVWASVTPSGQTGAYVSWVTFDPANASVAYATYSTFGVKHVWKSIDGGAIWASIDGTGPTGIPDIPVHNITVDPNNSSRLYVGTDLGVFTSIDGGANWNVENSGFANVPTEALVVNGSRLYAFTHGRGTYRVSLCSSSPTATVSGGGTICAGSTANIQAALTGTPPWDVSWSDGVVQSGVAVSPASRTVSPAVTTVYTVTALTGATCAGTSTGNATVTVNPLPSAPIISAPATVGAGSPNRTASVPLHAGSTYAWVIGNGTITAGQGTSQITFTAGTSGTPLTLSCVETNGSGCVSAPGTANVTVGSAGTGVLFYTLPPCRVLDTRLAAGTYGGPALQPSATRAWPLALQCGVPTGARAISANVTVVGPAAAGFLTLYPGGSTKPLASSINFSPGQTRANNVILPVSTDGTATIEAFTGSAGTVNFVLDVNGFVR